MIKRFFGKQKAKIEEEDLLSKSKTVTHNSRNSITNIVADRWDEIKALLKEGESLKDIYNNNQIFNEMMSYAEFKMDCYEQYKTYKSDKH